MRIESYVAAITRATNAATITFLTQMSYRVIGSQHPAYRHCKAAEVVTGADVG